MVSDSTGRILVTPRRRTGATFGPSPVALLIPKVTKAAFVKHSPASAALMTDWPLIVGPALAATTCPRRFASGTLTLGCAGPVALELQHLATMLIERINQHLGRPAVTRLRFVQDAAVPGANRPLRPVRSKPTVSAPIVIAGLAESPLRDALSLLGATLASNPA